jgi:hypothetical protein
MARLAFAMNCFRFGKNSGVGDGSCFHFGNNWRLPVADVDLAGHGGGDDEVLTHSVGVSKAQMRSQIAR